jgi:hypothetical protein
VALDDILRLVSVPVWLLLAACLAPAVWRLLRHRGRHLDPIWGIVFLLALNRLSFVARVSAEFSHGSAIVLALTMASFSRWYQRHDR